MFNPLLGLAGWQDFWYAVPLIIAVSLVYAATRQEESMAILRHSVRVGGWIIGFMFVVFVVIYGLLLFA